MKSALYSILTGVVFGVLLYFLLTNGGVFLTSLVGGCFVCLFLTTLKVIIMDVKE